MGTVLINKEKQIVSYKFSGSEAIVEIIILLVFFAALVFGLSILIPVLPESVMDTLVPDAFPQGEFLFLSAILWFAVIIVLAIPTVIALIAYKAICRLINTWKISIYGGKLTCVASPIPCFSNASVLIDDLSRFDIIVKFGSGGVKQGSAIKSYTLVAVLMSGKQIKLIKAITPEGDANDLLMACENLLSN